MTTYNSFRFATRGTLGNQFKWEIDIFNNDTKNQVDDSDSNDKGYPKENALSFYARSVNFAEHSYERVTIPYMNTSHFVPGRETSPRTMTINFFDNHALMVHRYFKSLADKSTNLETGHSDFNRNQRTIDVRIVMVTKGNQPRMSITARRCDIVSVGSVNLDYASSEVINFPVQLSYDYLDEPQDYDYSTFSKHFGIFNRLTGGALDDITGGLLS